MFEQMGGTKTQSFSTGTIEKHPRPKDVKSRPKVIPRSSPGQQNHYDFPPSLREKQPYNHEGAMDHQNLPISNYVPFSPQLVEVNINVSEGEEGSIHGNSATLMQSNDYLSEPSTPGSEPELQIDLGGGGRRIREKYSPAKARIAPPANRSLLGGIKRNVNPPSSLDFDSGVQKSVSPGTSSPQMVNNSSNLTTPKGSSFKRKGRRPGEALSALANSLYERKRIAEMGGQIAMPTPLQASTPMEGAVGAGLETMETDPAQEDSEEATATTLNQQFSSIYLDRDKTAIAVVDPDQKRMRKRKKPLTVDPPAKKASRVQSTNKTVSMQQNAQLEVARDLATPSPSTHLPQDVTLHATPPGATLQVDIPTIRDIEERPAPAITGTGSGGTGGGGQKGSAGGQKGTGGGQRGGAKGQQHSKAQNTPQSKKRGRPNKAGASKALHQGAAMAGLDTSKNATASPVKTATPTTSVPTPSIAMAVTTQDADGVRGVAIAPGIIEEESQEFLEGSGLLADTIRKVDRSFRARLNQMAGGAEDMGYQYFTEKVGVALYVYMYTRMHQCCFGMASRNFIVALVTVAVRKLFP